MKRLLFATAAALTVSIASAASAADLPLKSQAPYVPSFTWTGCYLGGSLGGGFAQKDITDPVQLVQDSFSGAPVTDGITTANLSPRGVVIGGQIGCDYQFAPSWVIGIEGFAAGSTMKGSSNVLLPLGAPDVASVEAKTDFLTSVTARLGYAFDHVLVYGKGGFALAGDKYSVSGVATTDPGGPFNFQGLENRIGWTAGAGVEWLFTQHWSVNLEYDYYGFGTRSVAMFEPTNAFLGNVDIKQNIQVVKLGFNFHIWGPGL
jgi:opacity protein-like surface antigen